MLDLFHFLRPVWFTALIPAIILFIFTLKQDNTAKNSWQAHCDPHLLDHLLAKNPASSKRWAAYLLLFSWLLAITALAGPTWSMYAQPVYQKNVSRVIALDVSTTMNATDVTPSRLQRAKYKVLDLLREYKEGQTGMLVFSSQPFVVSPLTSDSNTIASMVPVLDSSIVPVQGSDITPALQKAAALLSAAGSNRGQIILITASTPSAAAITEAQKLAANGYETSILAIGSHDGAPLKDANGNFATDSKGEVVFSHLDSGALQKLANAGKGSYVPFSGNNSDIETLLAQNQNDENSEPSQKIQTQNLWQDQGHWLIWLLLIFAALLARKGWLEKLC